MLQRARVIVVLERAEILVTVGTLTGNPAPDRLSESIFGIGELFW